MILRTDVISSHSLTLKNSSNLTHILKCDLYGIMSVTNNLDFDEYYRLIGIFVG